MLRESARTKILIVEDEAIIARDLRTRLTGSGFEVIGTSAEASDAFETIERDTPDIILMDISIRGEVDGISAADVIRQRYFLPVIFLTAHSDPATLERASRTNPFGYVVKPLGNANMTPLIMMALNKHRTERALDDQRKIFRATFQSLPDAVLVADASGEVLFLNKAAEEFTGWTQEQAAGNSLLEVAPMRDEQGRIDTLRLVRDAIVKRETIRLPRGISLITPGHGAVEVACQISVRPAFQRQSVGVLITLQDVTAQRLEEEGLRQEQQIRVAGELAGGVAQEFYALCGLIEDCAGKSLRLLRSSDIDLIQRASQIGKDMALQLMDLREARSPSHAVNVGEYLLGSRSLLQRFCRAGVEVTISPDPDTGYVLATGNHFEQMLMHLCLNGRHFLNGHGKISIAATIQDEPDASSRIRSYIRLAFLAERVTPDEVLDLIPFGGQVPDINLGIIRAIAIASNGFSRTTEGSATTSLVEVFLPRYATRESAAATAREHSRVILLIGLPVEAVAAGVVRATGSDVALLEAASLRRSQPYLRAVSGRHRSDYRERW